MATGTKLKIFYRRGNDGELYHDRSMDSLPYTYFKDDEEEDFLIIEHIEVIEKILFPTISLSIE